MSRRVLIVPKGFFGDMILTTPVLEALKLSEPDVYTAVLVPPSGVALFENDPFVDEVLTYDRKGEHCGWAGLSRCASEIRNHSFDVAYSFQRSFRTSILLYRSRIPTRVGYSDAHFGTLYTNRRVRTDSLHEVLRNLELVSPDLSDTVRERVSALQSASGAGDDFGRLRVTVPSLGDISKRVREIIADGRPYVLLSPGSAWETKRWDARGFHEVARETLAHGARVVITGGPKDFGVCEQVGADLPVINVCGETSMNDLLAIVAHAACVVCNDSLALHLASALRRPTVAVFCATSPRFGFGPWRNRAVVVERTDLFCKPCCRHGSKRCPVGTNACMTGVAGDEVFEHVHEFMSAQEGWRVPTLRIRSQG